MKNYLSDPHCRYTSLALGKSPTTCSALAALVRRPKKPSHNYFTIWKKRVQLKAITTFKAVSTAITMRLTGLLVLLATVAGGASLCGNTIHVVLFLCCVCEYMCVFYTQHYFPPFTLLALPSHRNGRCYGQIQRRGSKTKGYSTRCKSC